MADERIVEAVARAVERQFTEIREITLDTAEFDGDRRGHWAAMEEAERNLIRAAIDAYEAASRVRRCIRCGTEIDKCMGGVLARDFVLDRPWPREQCGICVMRPDAHQFLDLLYPKPDEEPLQSRLTDLATKEPAQ